MIFAIFTNFHSLLIFDLKNYITHWLRNTVLKIIRIVNEGKKVQALFSSSDPRFEPTTLNVHFIVEFLTYIYP